jgi:hypothetical protein
MRGRQPSASPDAGPAHFSGMWPGWEKPFFMGAVGPPWFTYSLEMWRAASR